jgi:hypothetical protein
MTGVRRDLALSLDVLRQDTREEETAQEMYGPGEE